MPGSHMVYTGNIVFESENRKRKDRYTLKNIVLIGMPGAGKSTVGVILAKVLGYQFIDADLVIQKRENRLLHEIISEEGLDGFLKAEENANVYIAQNEEKSIVATGGSVVYCEKAMQELKKTGRVIYLELEYDQLKKRLGNLKGRGVVLKDGQDLRGLYEERIPLYEKYADLTVNEKNLDVEQTLQKIVDRLSL